MMISGSSTKAYGDGSNGFIFDCFYINDVNSITVNGNQIMMSISNRNCMSLFRTVLNI